MPLKPDVSAIHRVLGRRNALIVHFSGTPKGVGLTDLPFPHDLQKVLQYGAMGGLSTSTVTPLDRFAIRDSHATGFVGIVLGLSSPDSLACADVRDCGSWLENGVRCYPPEKDITVADLEYTIDARQFYNEWVIRDYAVLGIFAASPYTTWDLVETGASPDIPEEFRGCAPGPKNLSLQEVQAIAPDQAIYSFMGGTIVKREGADWTSIAHSTLYP